MWQDLSIQDYRITDIFPSSLQHRSSASACRARAHLGCTCRKGSKQTHIYVELAVEKGVEGTISLIKSVGKLCLRKA